MMEASARMYKFSVNDKFNAEDRKVYNAWLRGTVAAYAAVVLCGIALVLVQAMTQTMNVAEFMTTAVALTAP
jgi:hypothetical protein